MAFFEKISGLGKGAAQKTKAMSETVRLSGAIKDEEKKQHDLCQQLGECYYQTCHEQAEGRLKDLCSQINASKVLVTQYKDQLSITKGIRLCPNCQSEAPANAAFCSTCGISLPPLTPPLEKAVQADGAHCNACGADLEVDASFCVSCGAKVTTQTSKPIEPSLMVLQSPSGIPQELGAEVESKEEPIIEAAPEPEPMPVVEAIPTTEPEPTALPQSSNTPVNQTEEKTIEIQADTEKDAPEETPTANCCAQCGVILVAGNLFCTSCGNKVDLQDESEASALATTPLES